MIRKLREDDLGQIVAIESATQVAPWTIKIFKDCLAASYPGWVIEHEGKVVCFAFIAMHLDECHLLNLCVHPHSQRKGFGSELLSYIIKNVKKNGAMMIYLEVRESNSHAISLYKKLNFIQIGTRKDYYPIIEGREDALVFARDLGME